MCPAKWPTDYSLLRAWYLQGSLYQFALSQYGYRHMFAECMVDLPTLASRIFVSRPAVYLTQVAINKQWADMNFPNRSPKKIVKPTVVAACEASKQTHRNNAAQRQNAAPAVYVLDTIYHALLKEDKQYFTTTGPLQKATLSLPLLNLCLSCLCRPASFTLQSSLCSSASLLFHCAFAFCLITFLLAVWSGIGACGLG